MKPPIPELLPGEPDRSPLRGAALWAALAIRAAVVLVALALSAPLWLLLGLTTLRWGRPPILPRAAQVWRYLTTLATSRPPPPGLPPSARVALGLAVLQHLAFAPLRGLAWHLDELLYGSTLDAVAVVAPLFEISAGRSGSTQLARYLEQDARLAAPSFLQMMFPYRWAWRLAERFLAGRVSRAQVHGWFERLLLPELRERHEGDPFSTDTFDAALYGAHLNYLSLSMGPAFAEEQFGFGVLNDHNRAQWEQDFVAIVDRLGRKRLLDAPGARLFIKGHFLAAAPALARRWPDARFLAMVRDPARRLQSAINYLRANPTDPMLGPPPWAWLAEAIVASEVTYCEAEQAWYSAPGGPVRCVIPFDRYVADLPSTMAQVYRVCFDAPPPAGVVYEHPPRRRHTYLLDRSLADLQVDEAALRERLAAYLAWMSTLDRPGPAAAADAAAG
jgi:hypothetical protein